jgi:hypothetical protein
MKVDPQVEAAWTAEIERRVKEIQSGAAKGIHAEQVMKEARRALNETRRLSSARHTYSFDVQIAHGRFQ